MPDGFGYGEAAGAAAFIVIKLKAGWVLEPDGLGVKARARRIAPDLPAGAALLAALPLPPPARSSRRSPAERELARFVHLRLPPGASAGEALALARSWVFVERASLLPSLSLA